jgi:hypothetical protein
MSYYDAMLCHAMIESMLCDNGQKHGMQSQRSTWLDSDVVVMVCHLFRGFHTITIGLVDKGF